MKAVKKIYFMLEASGSQRAQSTVSQKVFINPFQDTVDRYVVTIISETNGYMNLLPPTYSDSKHELITF